MEKEVEDVIFRISSAPIAFDERELIELRRVHSCPATFESWDVVRGSETADEDSSDRLYRSHSRLQEATIERELIELRRVHSCPASFETRESIELRQIHSCPATFEAWDVVRGGETTDEDTSDRLFRSHIRLPEATIERELIELRRVHSCPPSFETRESIELRKIHSCPATFEAWDVVRGGETTDEDTSDRLCRSHSWLPEATIERELIELRRVHSCPASSETRESIELRQIHSCPATFEAWDVVRGGETTDEDTSDRLCRSHSRLPEATIERELIELRRVHSCPASFETRESIELRQIHSCPATFEAWDFVRGSETADEDSSDRLCRSHSRLPEATIERELIELRRVHSCPASFETRESIELRQIHSCPTTFEAWDVVPDISGTRISDVSRLAHEEEILPEASEIISLASDTANDTDLALQHQSDVPSQSRLTSVVASGLLAVFGGLAIGYAMNITGGTTAMDGFLVTFSQAIRKRAVKATTNNFCIYFNIRLMLFTSIVQVSFIPSAWVAHSLIQSWGRKPVLIIGSILPLVGSAFVVWFPNDVVAVVGLSVIGFSMAFLQQVIPIICRELNVGDVENWISLTFSVMMLCGNTLTKGINLSASHNLISGWRWSFGYCGLLAIPLIPLSLFLTETPRFLIEKGRMDEAKVALERIRRRGVEAELQDLVASIEREDKRKWKRLSHSPLLVVNIGSQFIQRVVGLDSIVYFGPMFLQSIGYSYHASFLAPFIASVIRTGVAGFTYPAYTYFGRRRTLISTCVGMFLAQVCLFGLFLANGNPIYHLSARSSYIATAFAIPLVGFYSLLNGPSDWTRASYPEGAELLGTSLEMTVSTFMSLIMNPAIMWILCTMKVWVFAFFAVGILCVGWLLYKFLPEEAGSNEAIWRSHWFWKRFLPKEDSDDTV